MTVASTRVTLLFSLLGGAEEAATSFGTFPVPGATQADMEAYADIAVTRFAADLWDAPIGDNFPDTSTFLGAEARTYDVNNQLTAAGASMLATPIAGGSALNSLPPGVAEVVSLRTAVPGARGRGRMYLPPLHVSTVETDGRIKTPVRNKLAESMQDFFDSWNAASGTLDVAVVSQAGSFVTKVNQIRVGNVFDSQRRRRDALAEAYINKVIT